MEPFPLKVGTTIAVFQQLKNKPWNKTDNGNAGGPAAEFRLVLKATFVSWTETLNKGSLDNVDWLPSHAPDGYFIGGDVKVCEKFFANYLLQTWTMPTFSVKRLSSPLTKYLGDQTWWINRLLIYL